MRPVHRPWSGTCQRSDSEGNNVIRILQRAALAGMTLGITLVIQPWWNGGLRTGFFVTLLTTVVYIVVSHVPDRSASPDHTGRNS